MEETQEKIEKVVQKEEKTIPVKPEIAVDSGKSTKVGEMEYDLMKAGEYHPELKKLRTIANDYKAQYDRIDRKIMEMKSQ